VYTFGGGSVDPADPPGRQMDAWLPARSAPAPELF
jgi:hypothetical protein